jgi:hypothetical protein
MNNKSIFLYVSGSDYSAMDFEDNFNVKEFYQQMIDEGVTEKTVDNDDYYFGVEIKEFGEVDSNFEIFIKNEICDYDQLKASNIFRVE